MLIQNICGLKYPDEFIIRFFFKERLLDKKGSVLELGCGNGSNLSLFYQYGWSIIGVDISEEMIAQGNKNILNYHNNNFENKFRFICDDMIEFVDETNEKYDALILAGSLYYLEYSKIIQLFSLVKDKDLLNSGSMVYFNIRLLNDYRYAKGIQIGTNSFRLTINETGEENSIMTFFSEEEFINLISQYFDFKDMKVMHSLYDNYDSKNEKIIPMNSDLIVWGKVK